MPHRLSTKRKWVADHNVCPDYPSKHFKASPKNYTASRAVMPYRSKSAYWKRKGYSSFFNRRGQSNFSYLGRQRGTGGYKYRSNRAFFRGPKLHQEWKFLDTNVAAQTMTTTGVIPTLWENLVGITQGTSESQRIGKQVWIKKIQIRGNIVYDPAVADTFNRGRIMVCIDTQTNGIPATVDEVLESANINSFRDLLSGKRFKVLDDKMYNFGGPNLAVAEVGTTFTEEYYMSKVLNLRCSYTSTGKLIANILTNNIFILIISANATTLSMKVNIRIRYTDT